MSSQTITVECILIRKGGTIASTKDGTEYHFAPNTKGHHVAAFTNMDHAQEFLRISEGYRIYGAAQAAPQPAPAPEPVGPIGADDGEKAPAKEPAAALPSGPLEEMSIEDLRTVFAAEVGRKPSAKAKPETLIAQIEAVREEQEGRA